MVQCQRDHSFFAWVNLIIFNAISMKFSLNYTFSRLNHNMAAVTEQVWLDSLQGGFSTISCEICDLEITPTRYVCYDSNFRKFLPLHLILQRQITDYESVRAYH